MSPSQLLRKAIRSGVLEPRTVAARLHRGQCNDFDGGNLLRRQIVIRAGADVACDHLLTDFRVDAKALVAGRPVDLEGVPTRLRRWSVTLALIHSTVRCTASVRKELIASELFAGMAHSDSRMDCEGLADFSVGSSHALAVQSLNGLSLELKHMYAVSIYL